MLAALIDEHIASVFFVGCHVSFLGDLFLIIPLNAHKKRKTVVQNHDNELKRAVADSLLDSLYLDGDIEALSIFVARLALNIYRRG
jgi:hypothetical protein